MQDQLLWQLSSSDPTNIYGKTHEREQELGHFRTNMQMTTHLSCDSLMTIPVQYCVADKWDFQRKLNVIRRNIWKLD